MTHYFTDNSDLEKDEKKFPLLFEDKTYTFITYSGVFSKNKVDYGSYALLKVLVNQDLGARILDLGCGYGPIGIVLKSYNKSSDVDMIDVNPRAVELAKLNSQENKLEINSFVSDLYSNVTRQYNSIVTNPPIRTGKENIYKIFTEAYDYLMDNGNLFVVIRKQQGAKTTITKLIEIFGNCEVLKKDKGYYILKSKKG